MNELTDDEEKEINALAAVIVAKSLHDSSEVSTSCVKFWWFRRLPPYVRFQPQPLT